jgi:hypothetical protein
MKGLLFYCYDPHTDNPEYMSNVGLMPQDSHKDGLIEMDGRYSARPCHGAFLNNAGVEVVALGQWTHVVPYHFDNFRSALLSVFVMSTSGWQMIHFQSLAITKLNHTPQPYAYFDPLIFLYFICGVFFFSQIMVKVRFLQN